jgi:hypothetical protein
MTNLSNLLVASPFLGIAAIVVVYIIDYYQTLRGARLYQGGANQMIVVEGSYELNPLFTRDIDRLARLSPRFLFVLLVYSIFVWAVWVIFVSVLDIPQMYVFTVGAVLLLQGPVQLRHVRNIQTFKQVLNGDGIAGRIEYTRRFTYQASALEFIAFAGLYLVLALLAASWLLAGGAFGCAVLALRQYRMAS